jgi:hypothetical protein
MAQVSTTFMLFHVDLLSALGGKQRLIFINKALRALDGRIAVEGGGVGVASQVWSPGPHVTARNAAS